jgi:multicomponent Na+:H+ antiporter subunit D
MPDTYGWATPTSASILSALVSKAYIFLLFKIYYRVVGPYIFETMPIRKILFVLGILSMVFGSISAMRKKSINRMVAFSSAAQIGYIYMGIGIGGLLGYTAAMFQILAHAFTKSLLFLTTPRLAEVSGDSLLFKNLQGSGRRRPDAGLFFLVGALSMVGIPIFAGFSAKLMFGQAAVLGGIHWRILTVLAALGISSVLNAVYFIRTLIRIYSDPDSSMAAPKRTRPVLDKSRTGFFIAGEVLTLLNVFLGLFSWMISDVIYRGLGMFL